MAKKNNKMVNEYIQFSKRVTRWGIILVSIMLLICLAIITFCHLDIEVIAIINKLYTAYSAIIGITIGAYQGNSSLEKWTKARYNFENALTQNENENTNENNITETYTEEELG